MIQKNLLDIVLQMHIDSIDREIKKREEKANDDQKRLNILNDCLRTVKGAETPLDQENKARNLYKRLAEGVIRLNYGFYD